MKTSKTKGEEKKAESKKNEDRTIDLMFLIIDE
jgi:hypothetical protein